MISTSVYIIFAFAFVFILGAFRKHLVFEMQAISMLLTGSGKPGLILYTIIMLPGTIVHELSHWLMAEILRVPTGEISILPDYSEIDKQEKRLGSVMTGKTDPLRGFLIGMAPLIVGTILLILTTVVLDDVWSANGPLWQTALLMYAVVVLGNSMLASKSDRRYWPFVAVIALVIYYAAFKSGISVSEEVKRSTESTLKTINNALILTLGFEFVVIFVLFSLRKLFEKIRGKKITRS